jgi:hypothetical protein
MAQNRLMIFALACAAITGGTDEQGFSLLPRTPEFPKPARRGGKGKFGGQSMASPRHHSRKNPRACHKTRQK